jgi:hypothetical protein
MTKFIESFATQQLLPPWEAEDVQTWGFVVPIAERQMSDYLDAYFNGAYPDEAPYYYAPVPGAHFGLLSAVHFGKVASLNKHTASRLNRSLPRGSRKKPVAWDHLEHTEVYVIFPALRYPRSADNLLTGEPTLVWVEPFVFSDNDSVVFSSREIWGSDAYLGIIPQRPEGLGAHQLHLDLGMMGFRLFNPRSTSELISVLHIHAYDDSPAGLEEILKEKPYLLKFISILAGSGAFADGLPPGIPPSPYAGGTELNNLKQFRDCFDMSAAIYRAIVASKTTHSQVKDIVLLDASKVDISFMWSDSIADLLRSLFDVDAGFNGAPPDDHLEASRQGPFTFPKPTWVGPPPDQFSAPPITPYAMDWAMPRIVLKAEFAFSFGSKARFEVTETIHTYGRTSA